MSGRLRVGICGLGLIGSSLARALASDVELIVMDPAPTTSASAAQLGARRADGLAALAGCDLIALAAPTAENARLLAELVESGLRVPTFDLGSVKVPIDQVWRGDPAFPFVGTHPMAGAERSGPQAGAADLFAGCAWPVVVSPETDPSALLMVIEVVLRVGARAIPMSAERHDDAVALASHLPHLLSGALGATVAASPLQRSALLLAAGSFRDVSRVSASPPQRTAEFLTANRLRVSEAARAAARSLERAADLLAAGDEDALADWLKRARKARESFDVLQSPGHQIDVTVATRQELRDLLVRERDSGRFVAALASHHEGLRVRIGNPGAAP